MDGCIDFYFIPLAAAASALGSGKLDVLAVSSPKRARVAAERAVDCRGRIPRRRIPLLARTVGAGENAAADRRQTARRG